MKAKTDVYQIITDKIIVALEQGVIPWKKTWTGDIPFAQNYVTKHTYQGINSLMTNLSPYDIPYFLTFKQARRLGGMVKKGEKGLPIVFWNVCHFDQEGNKVAEEEIVKHDQLTKKFFPRYYSVFNIEQIEGIDFEIPEMAPSDWKPIDRCELLIANMDDCPRIIEKPQGKAYYNRLTDQIVLPAKSQFKSPIHWYQTLYHELIHSTGHSQRLNRPELMESDGFGSDKYSKEELVAEIGATFLCQQVGINCPELFENATAYINGWLQKLKDDKHLIFSTASKAKQAVQYVIGNQEGKD